LLFITHDDVSLRWLKSIGNLDDEGFLNGDIDRDDDVDIDDIKNMSLKLYRLYWWDKYHYGRIYNQTIATKLFDFAINMAANKRIFVCNTLFVLPAVFNLLGMVF